MADLSDSTTFLDLPLVMVIHVITFLTFSDAYNLCSVSREWMSAQLWQFCASVDLREKNYLNQAAMRRQLNLGRRTRAEMVKYNGMINFRLFADMAILRVDTPRLDKFSLQMAFASNMRPQVNKWLSIALLKHVVQISLDMSDRDTVLPVKTDPYFVPNFFFNGCNSTRAIKLFSCWLRKESKFGGFSNLISLLFNGVKFGNIKIDESFVGCPLLRNLVIVRCFRIRKIELGSGMRGLLNLVVRQCEPIENGIVLIDTPLLKWFEYQGPLIRFDFGGLDSLKTVILNFIDSAYPYDRRATWEYFSGLYSVKSFSITTTAFKILPWEYTLLKLPLINMPFVETLKIITSLEHFEMASILTFLRCAGYLKFLVLAPFAMSHDMIEVHNHMYPYESLPDKFWETGDDTVMPQLERVEYQSFAGRPLDFSLLRFILGSSPALKKVVLKLGGIHPSSRIQNLDMQIKELMMEPMASPDVHLMLFDDMS